MKIIKWLLWMVVAAIAVLLLCGLYLYTKDYGDYFARKKGNLVSVEVTSFGSDTTLKQEWLSLRGDAGLIVQCGLLVPRTEVASLRYPAVILMGGKATGKHAIDYALDIRNVIIVSPDYPYNPRESYTVPEFLVDVPAMRKAALDMVPSVMLLTDYLWRRPDVDTTKVILLGYSFGAPFVPCIVAHDRRAAVAAMVFGGGDLFGMIRHNVRRHEGPVVSDFVSVLAAVLLRPLEPLRYVRRISPIPLLMINGTEDEQIPREFTNELYLKAKEPKRLIWIESHHVNPRNVELTKRIVVTLKSELVKMGLLSQED